MALPWDVCATPIVARKQARLAMERGEVVFRPALFRQLGAPYRAVARATCPLEDHEAPHVNCSCGFYAVADDDALWRLGAHQPNLAILDVELAGRVIEHEHGYRASNQRAIAVWLRPTCVRCGNRAELLHHRRFGSLVPECPRCARRPVTLGAASASLGVPVGFTTEDVPRASWARRVSIVLAHMLPPLVAVFAAYALASVLNAGAPLAVGQLVVVGWFVTGSSALRPFVRRLGVGPDEAVRLQQHWGPLVLAVVIGCELVLCVIAFALGLTPH